LACGAGVQCVALRKGLINRVPNPAPIRTVSLLFQPIDAVAVTLAVDDVHLSIVVYVIADDREARIAQVPVRMEDPLVVVCVDVLEPPKRR
jgi:hypothetical protein